MASLAIQSNLKLPPAKTIFGGPDAKKVPNTYDNLRKAIDKLDCTSVERIVSQNPKLLIKPKPNQNPLKYACLAGKVKIVMLLLQVSFRKHKQSMTEGSNFLNDAIVESIRFQKSDMVRLFVQAGFDLNTVVYNGRGLNMSCIDFAIVGGHYQIAYYIYPKLNVQTRNIKNTKEFQIIGKKYLYRYVNYPMFIESLIHNVHPHEVGNYLKKQLTPKRKQQISRIHEGCWDWLMRVLGLNKKKESKQLNKQETNKNKTNALMDSANTKYPHRDSQTKTQSDDKQTYHTQRKLTNRN